jgi:hypothetical protein
MLENKVLRRMFGAKAKKLTARWRKLHYNELHNLYSSQMLLGSWDPGG